MPPDHLRSRLGIVVIGRNEGDRLVRCLKSLRGAGGRIVYVDSGSTDSSVAAAQTEGVQVVELDMSKPFTAARARNAGLAVLGLTADDRSGDEGEVPDFVQFVDGDCEILPGWLDTAMEYLKNEPDVAVVSGRLRERHPEASAYNALCDEEWDRPEGRADYCGGIAMMRCVALRNTMLFDEAMIAGEEPELCFRLRQQGWSVWCLAEDMALHDAAMMRFGQFWRRMRRGGFALALMTNMHGRASKSLGAAPLQRALVWGAVIPMAILLGLVGWGPAALPMMLIYPLQVARLALRDGGTAGAWKKAGLLTVGKFAEVQGAFEFLWRRLAGHPMRIIEHK